MKKILTLAILAAATVSAYAQVKVNDANNISISHSGGNLDLLGMVKLKDLANGSLTDSVLTVMPDGRIRMIPRSQLLAGLTGNYLSLAGGTLTGGLNGTTALFSDNIGIGELSSTHRLNIIGIGSTNGTSGLLVKNSDGKHSLEVFDDASVKIGHKLLGYSPSQHVNLNYIEADGGPNLYIGRDQTSGSTGYPWTSINIGGLGYQNKHSVTISGTIDLGMRTVIYQPISSSAIGNNGGALSIIRNQNSGNFGFGIDSTYRGYIQNYHAGSYYDLLLNPQGGYVGINNSNPTVAMDIIGKAKVSEAPTDPNGVVRKQDLDNAISGVSSGSFIQNQNAAAQDANFWTSGIFRMDGRLGLNNAAAGPWVLDVNTAQYAYRITSNQQDLYGQLVSASGRAELGVMQDALYLQSTSELANGINLIDNSNAVHTFKSGKLGVNNQTPAETLDVNGTGKFSGNVSFAGDIHSAVNSNLTLSAISGNGRLILSASDGIKVDLRDTGEGEFVVQNPSGALFSVISATKEVLIGEAGAGNAYLKPKASMPSGWAGSNLHVAGGTGDNGGGNLYLYGGDKQTSGNAGNTILAHTGSAALGKVGIGINTPAEMLHVAGKALVTEAPTDPNGVVRKQDLDDAVAGIDMSAYQTLSNLSADLTASSTKYPSVNAVNAGIAAAVAAIDLSDYLPLAGGTLSGALTGTTGNFIQDGLGTTTTAGLTLRNTTVGGVQWSPSLEFIGRRIINNAAAGSRLYQETLGSGPGYLKFQQVSNYGTGGSFFDALSFGSGIIRFHNSSAGYYISLSGGGGTANRSIALPDTNLVLAGWTTTPTDGALVKWSGTKGVLADAVAGTDYVTPSALANYITTNTTQTGIFGVKEWQSQHSWTLGGDDNTMISLSGVSVNSASNSVQILSNYVHVQDNNLGLSAKLTPSSVDFTDNNSSNTLQLNFPSSLAGNRAVALQDADGTIALTKDIPKMFSFTASGDGNTYEFAIPHGLSYTPTMVSVTSNSLDANMSGFDDTVAFFPAAPYAYIDGANVKIRYSVKTADGFTVNRPPVTGTNNLKWTILVK